MLYISPNGYLGGAERFVVNAAKLHTANNKIDVSILFFSEGEAHKEACNANVNCFVLKTRFRLSNPVQLIKALIEIRKIVKNYSPDILNLTMPYSQIVMSLATIGLGIKKVWFQHGPVGGRLDQIANIFSTDMIWYNSAYLMKQHNLTRPRAHVSASEEIVRYGIKNSKTHEIFENEIVSIGTAGRICSWKGFHNIIGALGELKNENKLRNLKFFIAGSAKTDRDKEYAENLVILTKEYGLESHIEWHNHVNDIEKFYSKLDVFIHSSTIPEPFGLVVAEAMSAGCLVIGSDSGGVADILINEKTGFTFPSTSDTAIKDLKNVILKILEANQDQRIVLKKIAKAGKNFITENYSEDIMIKRVEKLYSELLR